MKLILLKPNEEPKVVDFPDEHDYRDIKKILEIESPLECVERVIDGECFDFWCDDEGLLHDEKLITGFLLGNGEGEVICGNILIATDDRNGNMTGLTDEQIKKILDERNFFNNKDFMAFSKFKADENGEVVVIKNYNGFGDIKMSNKGKLLIYGVKGL